MTTATRKSVAQRIISNCVAHLNGTEVFVDQRSVNAAIVTLRQLVIELEKEGFASKHDVERCFDLIAYLERE